MAGHIIKVGIMDQAAIREYTLKISCALKRLEQYGIIRLDNTNKGNSKKPVVLYDRLTLDFPLAC